MIVELLFDAIFGLLETVFGLFNIPQISQYEIQNTIYTLDNIITTGSGFANLLLPMPTVKLFLTIILSVEVGLILYKLVMWILKKIPMLNVS